MATQRLSIESNNRDLDAKLFAPGDADGRAVLFIHAYGSSRQTCYQYARPLHTEGVTSLTFDLAGHGKSAGTLSELSVQDHLGDVRGAHRTLVGQPGVDAERVGVVGVSYGAYLAALAIGDCPVKSALLRSPPLYPDELRNKARNEYTEEDIFDAPLDQSSSALKGIANFTGKLLLVRAEWDELVTKEVIDLYAFSSPTTPNVGILETTGHQLTRGAQEVFNSIVKDWASEL